jgi:hypothetical protein
MSSHVKHFKLSSRGALLALISAAFANSALANSGNVNFAIGGITVTGADGSQRPLSKGTEVRSGDKIVSANNGRAQIRFSDGAFVSVQPNTEFDIKDYRFNGTTDGSERALFGLLKGAMRTVTGLVGRVNRNSYQIATPTATVGIRGTGGVVAIGSDGSTSITGTSGIWVLTNNSGSIDVPAGTSAVAGPNQTQPPQQTSQGPSLPPTQQGEQQQPFSENENRDAAGNLPLLTPLKSGPDYVMADADGGEYGGDLEYRVPVDAIFDSAGRLTQFSHVYEGTDTYTLLGTHAESGTDGVLAWGRWIGEVQRNGGSFRDYGPNQGLHYVIGAPTAYASLPTGMEYTYTLLGASSPTVDEGTVAPGVLNSATLVGNFANMSVTVNFAGSIDNRTFNASTGGSISNSGGAAVFSASGGYTGTLGSGENSASVQGFFAGPAASHAGMSYRLDYTTLGSPVVGAAALKFSSSAPASSPN